MRESELNSENQTVKLKFFSMILLALFKTLVEIEKMFDITSFECIGLP